MVIKMEESGWEYMDLRDVDDLIIKASSHNLVYLEAKIESERIKRIRTFEQIKLKLLEEKQYLIELRDSMPYSKEDRVYFNNL